MMQRTLGRRAFWSRVCPSLGQGGALRLRGAASRCELRTHWNDFSFFSHGLAHPPLGPDEATFQKSVQDFPEDADDGSVAFSLEEGGTAVAEVLHTQQG